MVIFNTRCRTGWRWLLTALFLAGLLAPTAGPAVAEPPSPRQVAAQLLQQNGGTPEIIWDEDTGTPSFITGPISLAGLGAASPDQPAELLARAFFTQYAGLYGLRDEAAELTTQSVTQDELGMQHVRFTQVVNGVPVFGGQLVAHFRGQQLAALNGTFFPRLDVNTTPQLDQASAQTAVLADLGDASGEVRAGHSGLVIYVDNGAPHLAWQVNVFSEKKLGNWLYFVDAANGQVVHKVNQLETSKSVKIYTAKNGSTLPGTAYCGAGVISDTTCSITTDLDARGAYTNTGGTYEYYYQTFGRDSYNNLGAQLKSTVHYKVDYYNAFWNGTQMVFGDGDTYARAFDVVAHELTHAVTDYTSHLIYEHQPGALNESLSDVMAVLAGCSAATGAADCDWLMGEDLTEGALRNLANPADPTLEHPQPDRWSQYVWLPLEVDNGGVHGNSGIPNKAAYLLTVGGTFNGVTVTTGLGYTKTEQIYYRAMTHYLTTYSDFAGMRQALGAACTDQLGGAFGISVDDCKQVVNAWAAVGIGNPAIDPVYVGPNLVFLPFVNYAVSPPLTCSASSILQNGSFESGGSYWTATTTVANPENQHAFFGSVPWAYQGNKVAYLGGYNLEADDTLYQTVNIPSGRTALKISFRVAVNSTDQPDGYYDKLYASLQPVGSVTLPEIWTVDNTNSTSSPYWWLVTLTYNELPYAGLPMRLYLRAHTDQSLWTDFFLDAASVQVQCARYPWLNADQAAAPVVVEVEPDPNPPALNGADWKSFKAP